MDRAPKTLTPERYQVASSGIPPTLRGQLEDDQGRVRSNDDNRSHLETHILPVLGPLSMHAIRREEIEALVTALDVKIAEHTMSSKTAKNVWGTCTRMFRDAAFAKPGTGLR
jgi:hypothetical protein